LVIDGTQKDAATGMSRKRDFFRVSVDSISYFFISLPHWCTGKGKDSAPPQQIRRLVIVWYFLPVSVLVCTLRTNRSRSFPWLKFENHVIKRPLIPYIGHHKTLAEMRQKNQDKWLDLVGSRENFTNSSQDLRNIT
jgi:hypothetical protein